MLRTRFFYISVLVSSIAFLSGCMAGPNYRTPDIKVPGAWSEVPPEFSSQPAQLVRWWGVFRDEKLNSLINRAMEGNMDLRLAEARIREARAQRAVVAGNIMPEIDAAGSYSRAKRSENTATLSNNGTNGYDLYEIGFDARWEIDIFGGVRRATEAAAADLAAVEESRRDVLVSLLAEVARNYLEIRGSQHRIAIATRNIELQRKTLELTRGRLEAGLGNSLEVLQAESQLASSEARVPILESSLKQATYRLGTLLGLGPGSLIQELSPEIPLPVVPAEVPVGLPSELLRRRPDIRRAEREIAAATARVGVATADLFPRFSLLGLIGLQSQNLSDLLSSGSGFWLFGPAMRWPVFDRSRIRANVEVQNAREEQALITYEKTILGALQEVESALVSYSKEQASRDSLRQAVSANRQAVEMANEMYRTGLVDFLNVLDSERTLSQSEDQLAQSDQKVATDLVAVFKALGGGWEE